MKGFNLKFVASINPPVRLGLELEVLCRVRGQGLMGIVKQQYVNSSSINGPIMYV
jgi:hypothetical protein